MNLYDLLRRQAQSRPHAKALVLGEQLFTYSEFTARVDVWAAALASRGIGPGSAFGLVMRNSVEFVVTFFALAKLEAVAVPVNFLLKAEEIAFIFEDAGVVGVLTQPAFKRHVEEARKRLPKLKDVFLPEDVLLSASSAPARGPSMESPPVKEANDENVAMIIYTSGTTGKPKGAMLTHGSLMANVEQCLAAVPKLSRNDVFMCLLPMFHSFAWTVCVLLPIYLGSKVVIIESIQPFTKVIKQIFWQRVNVFVAVPPVFSALLRVPFWRGFKWLNPVRFCICGAAALPEPVHRQFEEKFGIPLMEGYGLTEASPVVSLNPMDRRVPGTVGKLLPGIEVRFVEGEICVKGRNTMKGYFHQEEATRAAFLDPQREWLRTGDVGYLDEAGYLHISDRMKDLIIVKGLNVYPKEVEDVLLSHAAVAEAAVVGVADKTGDEVIKAYVILKEGQRAEKYELLKLCREKLATYKCPKDLEIRQELPKNTLGKILKRELRNA